MSRASRVSFVIMCVFLESVQVGEEISKWNRDNLQRTGRDQCKTLLASNRALFIEDAGISTFDVVLR